jgi:hypothetical protein
MNTPARCHDLTPWTKRCAACRAVLPLDAFRVLTAPHHIRKGGTAAECSECERVRWRSAAGHKASRSRKWRPVREAA